jgi:hypothetical protein
VNRSLSLLFIIEVSSISSSVFHGLSPTHDDVDTFFTEQQQQQQAQQPIQRSVQHRTNEQDTDWNDTHRWVDNLKPFGDASISQYSRNLLQSGTLGMTGISRDSLTGGTQLFQSVHNRREQQMSASHVAGIAQATPLEIDLRKKMATITIQRWYRKVHMRRKMAEAALKRFVRSIYINVDLYYFSVETIESTRNTLTM